MYIGLEIGEVGASRRRRRRNPVAKQNDIDKSGSAAEAVARAVIYGDDARIVDVVATTGNGKPTEPVGERESRATDIVLSCRAVSSLLLPAVVVASTTTPIKLNNSNGRYNIILYNVYFII